MPTEVLSHIALDTISISSGVATLHELTTVRSLLLTGRIFHRKLSLSQNPHLYANIFGLMFDVEAVKRRMGPVAIGSSALASELKRRVEALKRVKDTLDAAEREEGLTIGTLADLTTVFLMMTENDGKNGRQLANLVDLSRVPYLLFAHVSRIRPSSGSRSRNAGLALIVAIIWISADCESSGLSLPKYSLRADVISPIIDTLAKEDSAGRRAILDLFQPLIGWTSSVSLTFPHTHPFRLPLLLSISPFFPVDHSDIPPEFGYIKPFIRNTSRLRFHCKHHIFRSTLQV
jgi:hypothetical protein